MILLRLASVAIGFAAVVSGTQFANAQSTLENAVKEQKLNVCWINYPPGGYRDAASGRLVGYYFDIINEILAQVKIEPNYVESDWGTFIAALQAKKCDMSIAGVLMTIPRASVIAFSQPIFYLSSRLAIGTDEKRIGSLEELENLPGIRIAVQQGSSHYEYAKRRFPKAEIVALASRDPTASMIEIASKRADAAITDAWLVEKFQKEHPESVKIVGSTFNMEGVGWTFRQQDYALRDFFDVGLEKLRMNGTIEAMVRKYPESGRYIIDQQIKPVR